MAIRRKSIAGILGILSLFLAAAFTAPKASADEFDQAIRLTFSQPVAIPDQVLPAGTYWFMLPGHGETKVENIMQIMDADKKNTIATLKVNPVVTSKSHADISGDVRLTLVDRSPNRPLALVDVTYPGREEGHMFSFRYSKDEQGGFSEFPKVNMKVGKDGVLERYTEAPKN